MTTINKVTTDKPLAVSSALTKVLLSVLIIYLPTTFLSAQTTYNFSQINYNTLLINPGYTGNPGATSFQASYRGIIGASGTPLPRLFNFTLHAPFKDNDRLGWGGMMEVYRLGALTTFGLQPSFAYQIELADNQRIAVGASVRLNYSNFNNSNFIIADDPQDVLTTNLGIGIFYYKDQFFAGLGATNVAQFGLNTVDTSNPIFLGERPLYLHSGFWFQPLSLMKMKVAGLINRTAFFEFPNPSNNRNLAAKLDIAANVNAIFSDQYWFGFTLGRVANDQATADYSYFNISAVYTFNLARASYTYQAILDNQFSTSLNTTHVILLEFDIMDGSDERVIRYY